MQHLSLQTDDGLTLSALLDGPQSGPLVVLLHGFPDIPHSWLPLARILTDQGYRVLMPWLRGYTPESCRRTSEYGVMPAVRDLSAWMELLGKPPAHLVGHDWGAVVATTHANAQAHRWQSVASLAIPVFCGLLRQPWKVVGQLRAQLLASSYMLEMQKPDSGESLAAASCERVRQLWQAWSPDLPVNEEQLAPVCAVFSDPELGWSATRYYRALFTVLNADTRALIRHQLAEPAIPTLVLAGENDGCMVKGFQSAMFEAVADCPLVECRLLEDCGHFLQVEKPDLVAECLRNHWSRAEVLSAS